MAAHGRPRASQDIDIFIEPGAENAKRVAQALDEFGYPELAKGSIAAFTDPCASSELRRPHNR
jgi:hypothetical protein